MIGCSKENEEACKNWWNNPSLEIEMINQHKNYYTWKPWLLYASLDLVTMIICFQEIYGLRTWLNRSLDPNCFIIISLAHICLIGPCSHWLLLLNFWNFGNLQININPYGTRPTPGPWHVMDLLAWPWWGFGTWTHACRKAPGYMGFDVPRTPMMTWNVR